MHLVRRLCLLGAVAVCGTTTSLAKEQPPEIPGWLRSHVGDDHGQIARVVLQRARALYLKKVTEGVVKNPCYFAMDATRPNEGKRFYTICEADKTFRAVTTGHGSGRKVKGANFANGRSCVKNFGNALDSYLTTGGAYVTAETRTSFKGYYRSGKQDALLMRSFVQFEGEGETANARERAIGGHAAVLLRQIRYRYMPKSPHANENGCVPIGSLEDYSGGRSNGCTTWARPDADRIIPLLKDATTVYIYPESGDIKAVAQVVSRKPVASDGPYWNAACLRQIGAPKFWSREALEPLLAKYRSDPEPAPRGPATCKPSTVLRSAHVRAAAGRRLLAYPAPRSRG